MFTAYTLQDWEQNKPDMLAFLLLCIQAYKGSDDFKQARTATQYFAVDRTEVDDKVILRAKKVKAKRADGSVDNVVYNEEIAGNRIVSDHFSRFVRQESNFLLGNGVTLDDDQTKSKLGVGFDATLAEMGENALIQGVCYGYWNNNHIERINAYTDDLSGCFALVDEMTSRAGVVIQFWQLSPKRPMYVRLFEMDGVTMLRYNDGRWEDVEPKRTYKLTIQSDSLGIRITGGENYKALPVVPLYGNRMHRSELRKSIKSKIDMYNRVLSDFGDNLDRANDVYWVLNNFGGNSSEILEMIEQINRLKVVANVSDGMGGGSTAEPHTIEVPYSARQTALELLNRALYEDAMALDMNEIKGGSLTNVAIKAAMTNLNLKCDEFEWQCFRFVQQILELNGIQTEEIRFKRRTLLNDSETIQAIYLAAADLDLETRLKLNPMIDQDDIPTIIANLDAETVSGLPSMDELNAIINE